MCSTGASDNPADAATAMRLRAVSRRPAAVRPQRRRTAPAGSTPSTAPSATSNDLVRRARELGLQGRQRRCRARQSREALATEIDQLRAALVGAANTTYLDRPVLGGTTAGSAAFSESGGVVTFAGDSNPVNRTVAEGVVVDVSVAGPTAFGPDGDNVFDHLSALSAALRAGNTAGIQSGIDALQADGNRLVVARDRRRRTRQRGSSRRPRPAADTELSLTNALPRSRTPTCPATMVDLKMQEVAYQAALAATARVLQPSLVDFLR